ncbi:hypothetical protein HXX76_015704 [Chlamydomonas incerta]|uniref:Uncharacterized protein n=1 Tax=Chlamydomonas incerta TaxID=51695 RepID=A0A835S8T2_CHLIN|nr:hypothetical protein HXX76_015704 [Chlamydomonas incerta]|eukprot:KAG2422873.1 hypothetical protein HXX76_015704 [Chlamydomonas incerta]
MAALTPIAASRPAASTPCAAATPSPQQPQPQEQLTPAPRPGPGRQPFKAMDSNTTPTPALAPAFSFCTAVDYAAITPVLVRGQGATPSVASSTSGAYATPCTAASTAAGPCATPSSTTGADGTPEAPAAQALTRGVPGTESHRRYLVDCGKVVGVNNTMRRYHEEKPLRPPAVVQSTPFQERVNRELRAEEQLQQTLQGRGRR